MSWLQTKDSCGLKQLFITFFLLLLEPSGYGARGTTILSSALSANCCDKKHQVQRELRMPQERKAACECIHKRKINLSSQTPGKTHLYRHRQSSHKYTHTESARIAGLILPQNASYLFLASKSWIKSSYTTSKSTHQVPMKGTAHKLHGRDWSLHYLLLARKANRKKSSKICLRKEESRSTEQDEE